MRLINRAVSIMKKGSCTGLDKSGVRTPGTTRKRFWATRVKRLVARWTTKISHSFFLKNVLCIFNPFKAVAFRTDLYFRKCSSTYSKTVGNPLLGRANKYGSMVVRWATTFKTDLSCTLSVRLAYRQLLS